MVPDNSMTGMQFFLERLPVFFLSQVPVCKCTTFMPFQPYQIPLLPLQWLLCFNIHGECIIILEVNLYLVLLGLLKIFMHLCCRQYFNNRFPG